MVIDRYAEMCDTIVDVNNFAHHCVSKRIISPQDAKELMSIKSKPQQVKILLDHVVGPLVHGRCGALSNLLDIMETHGLQETQQLAIEMKHALGIEDSCVSYIDVSCIIVGGVKRTSKVLCNQDKIHSELVCTN